MGSRLGQHFLISEKAQRRIAALVSLKNLIEIGPGKGALTRHLVEERRTIFAIEKDSQLIDSLREKFSSVSIIEGDVREILGDVISRIDGEYELIGNIPYYLSGFLFRIISELPKKPEKCVFLIQKEVAEKLSGESGMNILRAFVLLWGDPLYEFSVAARYFSPPPKVDSAVVSITRTERTYAFSPSVYTRLVKSVFAHPRKTIKKNLLLGEYSGDEIQRIGVSGIDVGLRPSELSFSDLCKIALLLENK